MVEEETLIPVIKGAPSDVQYQSKIAFDFNYYGDFYFTPKTHRTIRRRDKRCAETGKALDNVVRRDDKIVSYQRFTDLPTEIRKLIFQLIASTLLCFDPKSKTYYNHVIIGIGVLWKYRYEWCFEGGVEKYLEETSRSKPDLSPDEKARLCSKFVKGANDFVYINQHHPNRDDNYLQVADEKENPRSTGNTWGAKLDWAYFEWIRGLANVSMQFRLELGSVIWERSRIYCRGDTKKSALGQFLTASPGITKGIKELVIDISHEHCLHLDRDRDESLQSFNRCFPALMELISQKLDLECLTLRLIGTKSALFSLAEGEGFFKILTSIRDLRVTKGFQFEIKGYTEIDDDGYCEFREADQQLNFIWEPKIREALLPDVLRPQIPKTDRNHYLASRVEE
ncbi:hypothetical protein EAF00_007146 [Botryotinia globosa]|nr:hypothetical protein EAF00_007146 [Botryotinia globosa]